MSKLIHESDWMRVSERAELNPSNKATKVVEIDIEGTIGGDWWGEEDETSLNTKEKMRKELKLLAEMKADRIIVNINSLGGSVNHGISIHDLLAQNKAEIITRVNGMTASIATVIFMAGDTREMSDNALFLTHRASYTIMANLNQVDLENLKDDLMVIDNKILDIYQKRTGADRDELEELMNAQNGQGRWLTAEEAKEYGFVDEIYEPMKAVAMATREQLSKMKLPIPQNNTNSMEKHESEMTNKTLFEHLKNFITETFTKTKEVENEVDPDENTVRIQAEVTVPDEVQNKLNEFSELLNKLETENLNLSTKVKELEDSEKSLKEALEISNGKVGTLETELAKANGQSTKVGGLVGEEDRDDNTVNPQMVALNRDLQKLRAELSTPKEDVYS
jgi:ATP-dependent Clp protease, protease subunit